MYLDYVANAGMSTAQVLDDIISALTGTITNKTNFSETCNKTDTTLVTTVGGGWSVHDAAAGTGMQCLKAPVSDDTGNNKYVTLQITTIPTFFLRAYGSWNADTHAGTCACNALADNYAPSLTAATDNLRAIVCSSARFIHLAVFKSTFSDGTWVALGGTATSRGVFERERFYAWDSVGTAYPFSVICSTGLITNGSAQIPYIPSPTMVVPRTEALPTAAVTVTVAAATPGTATAGSDTRNCFTTATPGQREFVASPIIGCVPGYGVTLGNLTAKSGVYVTATSPWVPNFSEFTMLGKTYVYLEPGVIVPKE